MHREPGGEPEAATGRPKLEVLNPAPHNGIATCEEPETFDADHISELRKDLGRQSMLAYKIPAFLDQKDITSLQKTTGEYVKAQSLEAYGQQIVDEMKNLLGAIKWKMRGAANRGSYEKVMGQLREGYFPAFTNGAGRTAMKPEENIYNATSSLTRVGQFLCAGDIRNLLHLLTAWDSIRFQNPALAARIGRQISALQPRLRKNASMAQKPTDATPEATGENTPNSPETITFRVVNRAKEALDDQAIGPAQTEQEEVRFTNSVDRAFAS